jgi:chloramphenicol 3-O phosphotransferase
MPPGTIILLNGTSSSGKSSVVRALQDMLTEPFLDAGIDKFIWMLPSRYLDRPLWDDVLGLATQAGHTGHLLISGMHQAIVALGRAGNNVIADHVLVEIGWVRECADLFADLPAYFVGVRCPLKVLEEREKSRADLTLGQVRFQFDLVHAHGLYDLEVGTSVSSPEGCARQITQRIYDSPPPRAFKQLQLSRQMWVGQ